MLDVKVGDKLYLHQKTGDFYVDMCKYPYTVTNVSPSGKTVEITECDLIFEGPRYYDTLPTKIVPSINGEKRTLRWSDKKQCYMCSSSVKGYPLYAVFTDNYVYQPYLN